MDPAPVELLPQSHEAKFLHIAHKDRWDHLKPVIVQLYTGNYGRGGKSTTITQVVQFMKAHYSFHAAQSEYPPRFRAWNVNKRIEKDVKDDITSALGRRKRPGTSTSQVIIHQSDRNKPFDVKKLKRHLMDKGRCRPVEVLAPGLLSSWNLPYAAFVSSLPKNPDQPSPFGPLGATPGYLNIHSPEALTPGRETAGPSPNMQLVYQKVKEDRASLFLQGRLKELIVSMCREDRSTVVDYFHDFYMHGFKMAKTWGQEPWNLITDQSLTFTPPGCNSTSPWTPSAFLDFPSSPSPRPSPFEPSQLCRWSIHVADMEYESVGSEPASNTSPSLSTLSFVESLHQSMTSNTFTNTQAVDLPLAQETIVQSLENNPMVFQLDSWRLAIMAGNSDLLYHLWFQNGSRAPDGIDDIHPFHLAASFLDGGHTCCMTFSTLSRILRSSYAFYHNIDNLGHTILDTLMVSILRSHTSLNPETASYGFHSPSRFPGEERDICGRWDADHQTVRELFKQGYNRIPTKWKHPFCHTAVQAVCHSIMAIFESSVSPNINALSGLFLRRCTECGLELKLGPLHTLVVTAFHLAQLGIPGETLFGALAVLICLLAMGADVDLKVNVSVEEILRTSDPGKCYHKPLSAFELMQVVPDNVIKGWSAECQTGWTCVLQALVQAEEDKDQRRNFHPDRSVSSEPIGEVIAGSEPASPRSPDKEACILENEFHHEELDLPCSGPEIGLLWATIQTELLTYRRVSDGDAWISDNFSMEALRTWLEGNSALFLTPLVQNQMMKNHSRCGWFHESDSYICPTAQEVCVQHFMNMDIYNRTTFIDQDDR
ncbi:hypothetical protein EDB80DRAFT_718854 [Ilyonectria destructans]|nr:hypothetical protein EDB80DRAFT_718854 [Ilyonectria destructans]